MELIERLRAIAPARTEGQSKPFAFNMDGLNLNDLNALINEAATELETLRARVEALEVAVADHAHDRQNWMGEIEHLRKHISEHEIPPELEVHRLRRALASIASIQMHSLGADGKLKIAQDLARAILKGTPQ